MTSPSDLTTSPQKYEVIRLRTGSELVGMTRDTPNGLEITLPMMCQLTIQTNNNSTLATFYPYTPLSEDSIVTFPLDIILHRSDMNQQFIPFYDEASSRWLEMVENGTIPLTNKQIDVKKELMDDLLNSITERPITNEEFDFSDEFFEDVDDLEVPDDPKKIH